MYSAATVLSSEPVSPELETEFPAPEPEPLAPEPEFSVLESEAPALESEKVFPSASIPGVVTQPRNMYPNRSYVQAGSVNFEPADSVSASIDPVPPFASKVTVIYEAFGVAALPSAVSELPPVLFEAA